ENRRAPPSPSSDLEPPWIPRALLEMLQQRFRHCRLHRTCFNCIVTMPPLVPVRHPPEAQDETMARIFAFIGNRPDLGAQLLTAHPEVVRVKRADHALGWGVGFFQSGETLLRRRPTDDRDVVDLSETVLAIRTTALLGHVRTPTTGELRTENTQPFRYGGWLFGSSGTLPDYEHLRPRLLEALPTFLRQNVRGETDSELVFYTFLSFLHDANVLRENGVRPAQIRDALRSAIALIDRMSAEQGQEKG